MRTRDIVVGFAMLSIVVLVVLLHRLNEWIEEHGG